MVSSPRRVLAQCGLNTAAGHNWYTGYCQESPVGNLSPEETHTHLAALNPLFGDIGEIDVKLSCLVVVYMVRSRISTSSSDRLSAVLTHNRCQ